MILGVLDEAIRTAKQQLAPKADALRPYEQVEWSRAELDHWLAVQAYEGALRAVESGDQPRSLYATLRGKEAVAELAESSLGRLVRVLGGGTLLAPVPVRVVVRGRPCARLPQAAVGTRLRQPVPHVARVSTSTATGRPSRTERQAASPATSAARPSSPVTGEGPPLSTIDTNASHSAR